jgi:hypothetical protein
MIKRCLNLFFLLTHGYPSCLPQQTPAIVGARLAGRWRVMSGKREYRVVNRRNLELNGKRRKWFVNIVVALCKILTVLLCIVSL